MGISINELSREEYDEYAKKRLLKLAGFLLGTVPLTSFINEDEEFDDEMDFLMIPDEFYDEEFDEGEDEEENGK